MGAESLVENTRLPGRPAVLLKEYRIIGLRGALAD